MALTGAASSSSFDARLGDELPERPDFLAEMPDDCRLFLFYLAAMG